MKGKYCENVSRYQYTEAYYFFLQDKYKSNRWDDVKIDLMKTENSNTNQDRREEDVPKLLKQIILQNKKIKNSISSREEDEYKQ